MDTLKQLKSRRDSLSAQIEVIENLIAQYEAVEQRAQALLSQDVDAVSERRISMLSARRQVGQTQLDSRTRSPNADIVAFEEVVRDILSEAETPVDRVTLLEKVTYRGITVGGQDPKNTLSSRLSRMAGVKSARGHGYWLADREGELSGLPDSAPE
jgi:hypothetical protein